MPVAVSFCMISPDILRGGLRTEVFGRKVYTFETIDSTNSCARALAACWADEGTVVIAEEQTAGRGRLGRSWHGAHGENLTFSLILRPAIPAERMGLLSLLIATGLARGIEEALGLRVFCKWPNDLLYGGRKLAGILLEGSFANDRIDHVVVGIGLNVNQREFPPDIAQRATSLTRELDAPVERTGLFKSLLKSLEDEYFSQMADGFASVVPRWFTYAPVIGRTISVAHQGEVLHGRVAGVNPDGSLLVSNHTGEHVFLAGDVTIVDMEAYAARH
jgi:BirA family transcriptional regulator, biotin operon repressor / biotin---[acetyl-CoA-carboxylase] ligase